MRHVIDIPVGATAIELIGDRIKWAYTQELPAAEQALCRALAAELGGESLLDLVIERRLTRQGPFMAFA